MPRRAFYLAIKVAGRYELDYARSYDYSGRRVCDALEESLRRMRLRYVDVCNVPLNDLEEIPSINTLLNDTLPALARVRARDRCRFIGLSGARTQQTNVKLRSFFTGYRLELMAEVIARSTERIDVVTVYCRATMADRTLGTYIDFFAAHGVGVINAGVTAIGMLGDEGAPPWHPAPRRILETCDKAREYCLSKSISLTRLSIHYAMNFGGVVSCLICAPNTRILVELLRRQNNDDNQVSSCTIHNKTFSSDDKRFVADF